MTPSLETRIQVLTAERDEYQKAAVRTAVNCKAEYDKLTRANKDLIDWFDALRIDHDKLLAAGKLANAYVEWTAYGNCRADAGPVPTAAEVSAALKSAGVS